MAPRVGLEPTSYALEERCLSFRLSRYGALREIRTLTVSDLNAVRLPIAPQEHEFVPLLGALTLLFCN